MKILAQLACLHVHQHYLKFKILHANRQAPFNLNECTVYPTRLSEYYYLGNNTQMKKTTAFTLIELMIVLAIVGILAFIAVPNMRAMISNSESNSISKQLMIDIMYTRNVAITNQANAQMIPLDLNLGSGTLAGGGGVNWAAGWEIINTAEPNRVLRQQDNMGPDPQIRSISSFTTEAGVTVATNTLDSSSPIEFNAEGIAVNRGAFEIGVLGCAGDNARRLRINSVGQVIGTDILCPAGFATR
jgi:prepilin-type N-terminal cleavage/methylation domain-containing protein